MDRAASLARFGLYGEQADDIAPEFLHVEPISRRSRLHGWTISPHSHPGIHQVLLLEKGTGELVADDTATALHAGALVVVPSHCIHAFRFAPGSEGWVFSFAIELLHDPRLSLVRQAAMFDAGKAQVLQTDMNDRHLGRLTWLLQDLAGEQGQGTTLSLTDRLAAQVGLLLTVAEELLHNAVPAALPDRQRALALAFRAIVDSRFRQQPSIPELARDLATTVPTLNRACRRVLGKPPGKVLRDRVLLEAMRYLTFTSASISRIADELGFADPAYFSRIFRKRTGMSASRFREKRGWHAVHGKG